MKKITLMILALGVTLGGLALNAEARGPGWGRGNGCPAWSNTNWKGYGPANRPAWSNGSGRGYGYGPANCPAYNAQGQGYGRGYGPGWMRDNAPPAPEGSGQ